MGVAPKVSTGLERDDRCLMSASSGVMCATSDALYLVREMLTCCVCVDGCTGERAPAEVRACAICATKSRTFGAPFTLGHRAWPLPCFNLVHNSVSARYNVPRMS